MSTDTTHPEKGTGDEPDLTRFQVHVLAVVGACEGAPKGIRVKNVLDEHYDRTVHHAQVYPNLDKLAARGLIAKGQKNARANEYRLTDAGRAVLREETDWLLERVRDAGLDAEGPA